MRDDDGVEWLTAEAGEAAGLPIPGRPDHALATVAPPFTGSPETISAGARRRPLSPTWSRRLRWGAVLIAAVALVGGAIQLARLHARPSASQLAAQQDLVSRIVGAATPVELQPVIARGVADGSCRPVTGDSMTSRVNVAVVPRLANYVSFDQSETFEAGSSLCAATVRLHGVGGVVLVVSVETPFNEPARSLYVSRSVSTGRVQALSRVTPDGWRVVVGAIGPAKNLPSRAQLAAIAADPGLTW
ncbi:hypothetical protein [Jatrophihabitans sp. GAS493]|uniref:hypothetical protein n=1 Tax=Jatrophihabitans sp. GAS493 TaxID=1907575 RepID=UPI000BB6D731|nr:hypothetical protein [Jatrophihabitans sp. GAS493]